MGIGIGLAQRRRIGRRRFRLLADRCVEGDAFLTGGFLRLVLEEFQFLGLGGELFKRLHVSAKFFFSRWRFWLHALPLVIAD